MSIAAPAAASGGTYFMVELATGVAEPAYQAQQVGLTYGLTAGATWKLKRYPFRFHLLMTATGRHATADGLVGNIRYAAERRDFDLYVSHRLAIPIFGPLRLYGEAGIGSRWISESVRRGGTLGSVSGSANEFLVVLGAGMQVRLTEEFSAGLRWEVTPIDSDADVISVSSGLPSIENRMSYFGTIALHF